MSTLNRALGKTFEKSLDVYRVFQDQVKNCVEKNKMPKSHAKIRDKMDDSYVKVSTDWAAYKRDVASEEFKDTEHNDDWYAEFTEKYYELCEKSDEMLEAQDTTANDVIEQQAENKIDTTEDKIVKQTKKQADLMVAQIDAESDELKAAINELESKIKNISIGALKINKAAAFKSNVKEITHRLNVGLDAKVMQCLQLLEDSEASQKNKDYIKFLTENRAKLGNILEMIEERVEVKNTSPVTETTKAEFSYLKKIDPPKFNGDMVSYPDFKRKWRANVSKANLSAEAELDRLKDNVPEKAAKMLFGEVSMDGAWAVLDKMFGNKTLIASKLKAQLKGIKGSGKEDHDIVINLAIEVKTIEKRLEELELSQMLLYDDEYLSSVFKVLPSNERREWLKFDKSGYEHDWKAMTVFLEKAREEATATKVMLASYVEGTDKKIACSSCGISGHKKTECTARVNASKVSMQDSDSSEDETTPKTKEDKEKELRKRVRDRCGKCPICKKRHVFLRKRDNKEWPSDRLISCDMFQKMTPKDRALQLEKVSGCSRCTGWSHRKADCKVPKGRCGMDRNGSKCQSDHSRLVCGSGVAYCANVKASTVLVDESGDGSFPALSAETLLCFQEVQIHGSTGFHNTCFDNGSNRCLVRNDFATQQRFPKENVKLRLKSPGIPERIEETCYYTFVVTDNHGTATKVWAFGVDDIIDCPDHVDLSPIRHMFPHLPDGAFTAQPTSQVKILIGNNFLSLHPRGGDGQNASGNLRMLESNFGSGWVLAGTHPALSVSCTGLNQVALAVARINRCDMKPVLPTTFWESECMGVLPQKRCGRCLKCSTCSDLGLIRSRKEQEDLNAIKEGVSLVDGEIRVKYQFEKDPRSLPNNRGTAVKIAEKLERRLMDAGHLEYYNQEFLKIFERGAAVKLSAEEIKSWQGPVNYISHHGVEQDSVSTPLRIVTNSSLKNGGKSLNDCLITGPKSLNSMFDIMLRFRCHESGLVFDLSKAYNCLKTGPVERHLRRFIWRFSPDDQWQDFAFDCVHFGDCPAANCLEVGRDMTAEAGRYLDSIAADKIINDSYVDDGVTGGFKHEVERMKGERLEDGSYNGTLAQILGLGNLTQ